MDVKNMIVIELGGIQSAFGTSYAAYHELDVRRMIRGEKGSAREKQRDKRRQILLYLTLRRVKTLCGER